MWQVETIYETGNTFTRQIEDRKAEIEAFLEEKEGAKDIIVKFKWRKINAK